MLWSYIKEIVSAAVSSAEEGSAMIEIFICLGIFFLPKLFKNPDDVCGIEYSKINRKF
jgi:hypothetical protein